MGPALDPNTNIFFEVLIGFFIDFTTSGLVGIDCAYAGSAAVASKLARNDLRETGSLTVSMAFPLEQGLDYSATSSSTE